MEALPPLLFLARVLLSLQFLLFGVLKFVNSENMYGYIESFGLPGELVWPAGAFQVAAGLMVVVGWHMRLAAVALAGFCVLATAIFHSDFTNLGEVAFFLKDLGAAGGFILLAVLGPGTWSIDDRSK